MYRIELQGKTWRRRDGGGDGLERNHLAVFKNKLETSDLQSSPFEKLAPLPGTMLAATNKLLPLLPSRPRQKRKDSTHCTAISAPASSASRNLPLVHHLCQRGSTMLHRSDSDSVPHRLLQWPGAELWSASSASHAPNATHPAAAIPSQWLPSVKTRRYLTGFFFCLARAAAQSST